MYCTKELSNGGSSRCEWQARVPRRAGYPPIYSVRIYPQRAVDGAVVGLPCLFVSGPRRWNVAFCALVQGWPLRPSAGVYEVYHGWLSSAWAAQVAQMHELGSDGLNESAAVNRWRGPDRVIVSRAPVLLGCSPPIRRKFT